MLLYIFDAQGLANRPELVVIKLELPFGYSDSVIKFMLFRF